MILKINKFVYFIRIEFIGPPGEPGASKIDQVVLISLFEAIKDGIPYTAHNMPVSEVSNVEIPNPLLDLPNTNHIKDVPLNDNEIRSTQVPRKFYEEIMMLHHILNGILRPDGTKEFPVKTCRDLFAEYPEKPSGSKNIKFFH